VFDAEGRLIDEKVKKLVTEAIAGFAAFVEKEATVTVDPRSENRTSRAPE
jgi:hypothetical protein